MPEEKRFQQFYTDYGHIDVLFTKEVVRAAALVPKNIVLKCGSYHFPAVLYSANMHKICILVQTTDLLREMLIKNEHKAEVRFYIQEDEEHSPYLFFVSGEAESLNAYANEPNFNLLTLNLVGVPPEPLMELLAPLIEATVNAQKRKDERLFIGYNETYQYNIDKESSYIRINNESRRFALRDISISGAGLVVLTDHYEIGDLIEVHLWLLNPRKHITLAGKIVKTSIFQEEEHLTSLSVQFISENVPIIYKVFINSAFEQRKKLNLAS